MTQDLKTATARRQSWIGAVAAFAALGALCLALAPKPSVRPEPRRTAAPQDAPAAKKAVRPAVAAPRAAEIDPGKAALDRANAVVAKAVARYQALESYQATFESRELDSKGKWAGESSFLKFEKPFTIFMAWTAGEKKGLQILYAENRFDDKMFVRMPGMLFAMIPPVAVAHDDPRVMKMSKHSIKNAGIGFFLQDFSESMRKLAPRGQVKVLAVKEGVDAEGEKGTLLDVVFLDPREEYARRAVVFSQKTGLPVEIKLFKGQDEWVESYLYKNLKIDTAPADAEFKSVADGRMYDKFQSAVK